MTIPNLATARFVLQCLFDELEEYDRCIPVARNVQVGNVADALLTILNNRELQRLAAPKVRLSPRRPPVRSRVQAALAKRKKSAAVGKAKGKSRLSRSA
jgi:hypothetical protein